MLEHKKLDSTVSYDPLQWLSFSPLVPITGIADRQLEMYSMGFRLLSITDKSVLNLKDENKIEFSLFFKRSSLVAYGDGFLYYQNNDVIS